MTTLEKIATAIMEEENPNSDNQYIHMARAAVEVIRERLRGTVCEPAIDSILEEK